MKSRIALLLIAAASCAGPRGARSHGTQTFPPRPPTCELTVQHTSTPGVLDWDDLGVAEVTCHINIGLPQCMRQFRAEACRMGGDIVYAMPDKPLRPGEQAIVYRGRVARTRVAPPPKNERPTISSTNSTNPEPHPQTPPPAVVEPTVVPPDRPPSIVASSPPDAGTDGAPDR